LKSERLRRYKKANQKTGGEKHESQIRGAGFSFPKSNKNKSGPVTVSFGATNPLPG
jgi:hypothetical protein